MVRNPILSKPRYEPRRLDGAIGDLTHGIWDSFAAEFVMAERHTHAQAIRATARYNQRYEEFLAAA